MDLLMKTRLKAICRELSFQLTEGVFSEFTVQYNDPADVTNKPLHCLKVQLIGRGASQSLLLSWHTRDTWIFAVQHLISEFKRETQGDLIDDAEEG